MKIAAVACLLALWLIAAEAAPAQDPQSAEALDDTSSQELQRTKRSQYGPGLSAVGYTPPCAAAAPLPYHLNLGPALHGPSAGYGLGGGGLHRGLGYGGYGLHHYRAEDFEGHPESSSNMDHAAMMQRAYGGYEGAAAAGGHIGLGGGLGLDGLGLGGAGLSAASGPAYGIFPGSVGGCNVPLLLSCSPSIVPGHLVKNHASHYGAGAAPSLYKGAVASPSSDAHAAKQNVQPLTPESNANRQT